MGLVTFTPFGRGSTAATTDIDTPYDTLLALSSAMDGRNFHPNAQIHENFITWNTHDHSDGSLGRGILSSIHFQTFPISTCDRLLHSFSPKTLILWGTHDFDFVLTNPDLREATVRFDVHSYANASFAAGTLPKVFLMIRHDADLSMPLIPVVTSRTSVDFTYTMVSSHVDFDAPDGTIYWLAMGVAPGYLPHPDGRD